MITDRGEVDLLLRLLEARELDYTSSALVDYFGHRGRVLIDAGLMVLSGFDRTTMDDAGEPFEVEADPVRGLGYHHPFRGWVAVEQARLQRYRPDLAAIFGMLLADELIKVPRGPLELEAGLCWEIGRTRLQRTGLVDVLFARRLDDRDTCVKVKSALERRPSTRLRLLLTSTRDAPAAALPMMKVVPITEVLSSSDPSRLDPDILKARFAGKVQAPAEGPLHLSEDGRTLTIQGRTEIIFRSEKHIQVIRALVEAYRDGKRLNAAVTLEEAGLSSRTFQQAFGRKWKELSPYLKAQNQLWAFEF